MTSIYCRTGIAVLASACSMFIVPAAAVHALDVSIGSKNGVNASVGVSSERSASSVR